MHKKIIVVGGSASGPKAAARARRLDYDAEITIIQKAHDLSMASCGYPYYVGGFFDNRNQLLCTPTGVLRDPGYFMKAKNINALTDTEVTAIDRKAKTVATKNVASGETAVHPYDKLILAVGAHPKMPPVPGIDLEGITTLQSMPDADFLRKVRDEGKIKKAVVVGGGLIGIETCEALQLAGIKITVVEMLPQILMFLDWQLAKILENHVKAHAADVITDNAVAAFLPDDDGKLRAVKLANGDEIPCELAVRRHRCRPEQRPGERIAGLEIGKRGGVLVDKYMQTSDPRYLCRRRLYRDTSADLGGECACSLRGPGESGRTGSRRENSVSGNVATFPGTIQTGVCKVFDFLSRFDGSEEQPNGRSGGIQESRFGHYRGARPAGVYGQQDFD